MRSRLLLFAATVCGYISLRGVSSFSRFRLGNAVVGERSTVISPLQPLQSSNEAEVGLKKQHHHPYKRRHPVTGRSSTHKIFTAETIQRVNSKAKLTELFKVRLRKGDVNISGGGKALSRCPFHNDRTPSCSIDDNLGVYHCFGCGASGNAIKFIMEADGLSFRNAIEQLASEIGVDVEYSRTTTSDAAAKREQEQVDSIYLALEMAALFYARCLSLLPQGGKARSYLSERGISASTTVDFLLGFSPIESSSSNTSPSHRSPLVAHLQNECGLDEKTLILAGLVSSNNVSRDRMHGRLVMPIRDHLGVVIGFGGRYIDVVIEQKQKEFGEKEDRFFYRPKYLNSPQTKLFKKNQIVFGLDRAKSSIRLNDCGLVVEGYFDAIALHEKGIKYAVASMGCSLTEEQLNLVSRFTPSKRIIICPDDDQAGYKAIERLCYIDPGRGRSTFADMTELGIDIRVASLSDMSSPTNIKSKDAAGQWEEQQQSKSKIGLEVADYDDPVLEVSSIKDPCDFVSTHGAKVFEEQVVKKAVPWTDWYANRILIKHADWESDSGICRNCVSELTTFFSLLPTSTDRTMHIYRYASVLCSGNSAARIQLESDLLSEVVRKERKRNALRSRVENLNSDGIGFVSNSSVERRQPSYSTSSSITSSNVVNSKNRVGGYRATRTPPSDSAVLNKLLRGEATGYNVKTVDDKATSIEQVGERQHFTWEDVLRAASKAAELATSGPQTRRGSDISRSWQRKNQRKATAKGSSKRGGSVGKWGTWGDTNYEWLPYEDDNFYQHEIALASAELAILRLMICDASRRCELVTNLKDADIHFTASERQRLFDVIATLPTETKDLEGLNLSPYLEKCITAASGSTSGSNAEVMDMSVILRNILQDEENATHNQCCSESGEQELQEAQLVLFRARAASMVSSLAQELYNVQKSIATICATGKELHEVQLSALEADRSVAFEKLHEVCVSAPRKNLADFFLLVDLLK